MKLARIILTIGIAYALCSVLAGSAFARNLEISSQTDRASFREVSFAGVFGTTDCELTLEGSLHTRTIAKTVGALIGYVQSARLGACSAGTATILTATLPWHVRYAGFGGTLPNITRLRTDVIGFSMAIRETGMIPCLFRSTATEPVRTELELSAGTITSMTVAGRIRTGAECFGASGNLTSDTGAFTVLNSTARITIRLI